MQVIPNLLPARSLFEKTVLPYANATFRPHTRFSLNNHCGSKHALEFTLHVLNCFVVLVVTAQLVAYTAIPLQAVIPAAKPTAQHP